MPAVELLDYTMESITPGRCFFTYSPKDQSERVFRIGQIDLERGWIEIGERGIAELAAEIGWVEADQAERLKDEIRDLRAALVESQALVDGARIEVVAQLGAKVTELTTKLASEKKKTRRYKTRIEEQAEELLEMKESSD